MGRRVGAGLCMAVVALAIAACGEESEKFSDGKIADAAGVEGGAVDKDPFCKIDDYLNDSGEIEEAADDKKAKGSIIASKEGNVGVVVADPTIFADDCAEKVRAGLDKLDPKPKEK